MTAGQDHISSTLKVDRVFKHFDADLDGALNQAELDHFIRSVNPGVAFNDSQVSAITSEVYSEYSEFLLNGGLSLAGLHQTYADGIGDIHRDFATLNLGNDKDVTSLHDVTVVQDAMPKRGILEESKQQPAVSSPHRTRFVPAPIVKASSGPLPTPLAVDLQLNGSHHQQGSAGEGSRLGERGTSNENDAHRAHPQQPMPSRAAPAKSTSARRLGNEEMQQAEALVQASRSNANAGVAGMIARFEPSDGVPAEPAQVQAPQTARPSAFPPQAAGPAAEQAAIQQHPLSRRASDAGQPHAMQPQSAARPSDASSAAPLQQDVRPSVDQSAQPQEMQRHIRRNLSNAASLPSPADTNAVFDKFMEAGFRAASRHDYDKAIRCFEQALSIRPDDPRVFFRLGNALFAQQRYAEARRCFGQSLELAQMPDDASLLPKVHVNLGIAMEAEGLLLGACEHYREAAAQNTDHFRALKLLGSALYALGDFQGAQHELQQALRLKPDYPDALCDLGCTYCALGKTPEAARAFSDALAANPQHLEALFNKGNLHRQCNEFADAVECYENVLQLDSSHWRSLLNKAVAEIGLGRQDAARHSLQAAYKLSGHGHALLDEVKLLKRMARRSEDRDSLSRLMSQISGQSATSNGNSVEGTGPSNGFATRDDTRELAKLGMTSRHVQQQVDISLCQSLQPFARLPAAAYVMASQLASAATDRSQDHMVAGPEVEALVRQLLKNPPGVALQHIMRSLSTRVFPLLDPQRFGLIDYSLLLALLSLLADAPVPERCQAAYTVLTARHPGSRVPQGCAAFLGNLLQAVFIGQGIKPMQLNMEETFQGAHISLDAFRTLLISPDAGLAALPILPAVACGRIS